MGRVSPVPDDLGHGKGEQGFEVPQLSLDSRHSVGVDTQAGRVRTATGDGEKIAEAVDRLHRGGRIVDCGRQSPYRDVDELTEAESRILDEGSFIAHKEEPSHLRVGKVGSVHHSNR